MSFSSDCKEELCRLPLEKSCCSLSELAALYMTLGSVHLLGRGKVKVEFAAESAAVARRVFLLLQRELQITAQAHAVTHARFGGTKRYVLTLNPAESPLLLSHFSMMENSGGEAYSLKSTSPRIVLSRACCSKAFLRGAFLGAGILSKLESGYHMEFILKSEDFRFTLAKSLQRFELPVQKSRRKNAELLFFTQGEQLSTLLTLTGAHRAVMKLENLRVEREVISQVNRAMNCDAANLQKLVHASHQQLLLIERLMDEEKFESLPPSLKEIALARLRSPEASLVDLGQSLNPPLGKSGVNHRMRRLMELAGKES